MVMDRVTVRVSVSVSLLCHLVTIWRTAPIKKISVQFTKLHILTMHLSNKSKCSSANCTYQDSLYAVQRTALIYC